jgi:hypothetical protein
VSFANIDGDEEDDNDPDHDVSLNTNGKTGKKKKEPRDKSTLTCRRCGQKGHWPSECDNPHLVKPTSDKDAGDATNRRTGATLVNAGNIDDDDKEDINDIIVG